MKNNVIKLENHRPIQEENHSLTLKETIERLRLKASSVLKYESILKDAKGDNWYYDGGEFLFVDDGEVLKGYPVYNSYGVCVSTVEMEKEIFLTKEGEFLVVYTAMEFNYCQDCGKIHCRLPRFIAEDQSLVTTKQTAFNCI